MMDTFTYIPYQRIENALDRSRYFSLFLNVFTYKEKANEKKDTEINT